jgi:hypothetical protein
MIEAMEQVHMTEDEVTGDFAAVLRPASYPRRTISECIVLAERREKERGYAVTLDPEFAADVEEIICDQQPWNPPTWD